MSIDPYGICPCGSGKKVKFCCCSDMIADLDRVAKMLEGEQRIACLERVEKLVASGKDRAAILSIKAMLEMELQRDEAGRETVARFVEKYPDNPVALAQQSMMHALDQNTTDAVDSMQKALSIGAGKIAVQVREAIEMVGRGLLLDGDVVAARRHLMLAASCNGDRQENEALSLLARVESSPRVPLLLKDEPRIEQPPDDLPWKEEYERAVSPLSVGAWRDALRALESLEAKYPDHPFLLKSTAWLCGWLGDRDQMIDRLRRYASLEGIPLDEAVEAEAVAQFIDPQTDSQTVDVLNITFAVDDMDTLIEQMQSDDRVSAQRIDPEGFQPEDGPPPKMAFVMLDRPMPKSGVGIEFDAVPIVYGQVLLFGKQTDCDARLEYLVKATEDLEQKKQALRDVAGKLLGEEQSSDVFREIPAIAEATELKWRFPVDTPADHREAMTDKILKESVLNRIPHTPMHALDGKTPVEASKQPEYRVRLLATLLRLELMLHEGFDVFDFNQLRTELGLPIRETIDPWTADIAALPLVRLSHLDAMKLSDEQIVQAFFRAATFHHPQAIRSLGAEIVIRSSLDQQVDKASVYRALTRVTGSSGQAIKYLAEGMALAKQAGQPIGHWKVEELGIRLGRGETVEVENLLADIQKRHFDEPGVSEAVMSMLEGLGVMGSPVSSPEATEEASQAGGPAPSAGAGKIWTPDATGDPKEKPSLWVPGMD